MVCLSIGTEAQIHKVRRVYYLDCSYSMVTNKLWDKVRDNLITAIDNVNDETTELIVIPFADNSLDNPVLKPMIANATVDGKKKLKSQINALTTNKNTMTYHYIPLRDFYNNRINPSGVTYMFLMTDGIDEDKQQRAKKDLLPLWGKKFGDKNVFGFYVMLHNSAKDNQIGRIIDNQNHLWKVETADVNINIIRLQPNATYNAKNEKYFDVTIDGDMKNMRIDAQFADNTPYKIRKVERMNNNMNDKESKVRMWVEANTNNKLPVSLNTKVITTLKGGGQYDFLVTESISVKCEYKPERSLKVSVR